MFMLMDTEKRDEDTCYLNHSCLSTMSAGSLDMAWTTESEMAAYDMQAKAAAKGVDYYILDFLK